MDLTLTIKEKIAFLHALSKMMMADGEASPKEIKLLNSFASMKDVNVGQQEFNQALLMEENEAKEILSSMSDEKRRLLGFLLQDMARADGKIESGESMYWMKMKNEINIKNLSDI